MKRDLCCKREYRLSCPKPFCEFFFPIKFPGYHFTLEHWPVIILFSILVGSLSILVSQIFLSKHIWWFWYFQGFYRNWKSWSFFFFNLIVLIYNSVYEKRESYHLKSSEICRIPIHGMLVLCVVLKGDLYKSRSLQYNLSGQTCPCDKVPGPLRQWARLTE